VLQPHKGHKMTENFQVRAFVYFSVL